ncbi:MAG TPA: hypothetical protein VHD91_06655 [Gaiellaceae bacterium]|nr:hypothetical protein [Gaiellaceae bacterium]
MQTLAAISAAVALVAPPPHSIKALGNVPLRPHDKYRLAFVSIDLSKGPGHKLEFGDLTHSFRALSFASIDWGSNYVRFVGTGISKGKRVPFVAVAIHRSDGDSFYISWDHSARRGGPLKNGGITIDGS